MAKRATERIRRARRSDIPQWIAMRRELWPKCPLRDHRKEMVKFFDDTRDQPAWVAETPDGDLAGFLEASVRNYADGAGRTSVGYLEGWFVKPKYRKEGIGRALVRMAEGWARKRGFSHMGSDTWIGNKASHLAHLAMGYREVGKDIHYVKKIGTMPAKHAKKREKKR